MVYLRLSTKEKGFIATLLTKATQDLSRGLGEESAGWVHWSHDEKCEEVLKTTQSLQLIDSNPSNEYRVKFSRLRDLERIPELRLLSKQVWYFLYDAKIIKMDERMVSESIDFLSRIENLIKYETKAISFATVLGFDKLLSTNDIVAPIELILENGFSPQEWFMITRKAIPLLCQHIARRLSVSEKITEMYDYWYSKGILTEPVITERTESTAIDKVPDVLNWQMVIDGLPDEILSFLGLFWFLVLVLEKNSLSILNSEQLAKQEFGIISVTERILNIEITQFYSMLDIYIEKCKRNNIYWPEELFTLTEIS